MAKLKRIRAVDHFYEFETRIRIPARLKKELKKAGYRPVTKWVREGCVRWTQAPHEDTLGASYGCTHPGKLWGNERYFAYPQG